MTDRIDCCIDCRRIIASVGIHRERGDSEFLALVPRMSPSLLIAAAGRCGGVLLVRNARKQQVNGEQIERQR